MDSRPSTTFVGVPAWRCVIKEHDPIQRQRHDLPRQERIIKIIKKKKKMRINFRIKNQNRHRIAVRTGPSSDTFLLFFFNKKFIRFDISFHHRWFNLQSVAMTYLSSTALTVFFLFSGHCFTSLERLMNEIYAMDVFIDC